MFVWSRKSRTSTFHCRNANLKPVDRKHSKTCLTPFLFLSHDATVPPSAHVHWVEIVSESACTRNVSLKPKCNPLHHTWIWINSNRSKSALDNPGHLNTHRPAFNPQPKDTEHRDWCASSPCHWRCTWSCFQKDLDPIQVLKDKHSFQLSFLSQF